MQLPRAGHVGGPHAHEAVGTTADRGGGRKAEVGAGKRVRLVPAGGGARGAYQAVLLPELERRDERPTVIVGTSTGALNAAFLAAKADCDAEEATRQLVEAWSAVMSSVLSWAAKDP